MDTGRPTKYTADSIGIAEEYIDNYALHGDTIPQNSGLATALGICVRTLYYWAEEHDAFLRILDKLKAKQERVLINSGLNGDFNSAIVKLVLGKHGYHDKQDMEHTGAQGAPLGLTIEFVKADDTDT